MEKMAKVGKVVRPDRELRGWEKEFNYVIGGQSVEQ